MLAGKIAAAAGDRTAAGVPRILYCCRVFIAKLPPLPHYYFTKIWVGNCSLYPLAIDTPGMYT